MSKIAIVGTGYVGLVTGACFADLGNEVCCLDINRERIEGLKRGVIPIYEPGLDQMVSRNVAAGRLSFTVDYNEAINTRGSEFVFLAVGTPSSVDGDADLQYVYAAAKSIAEAMGHFIILVNKSTVPVGTGDWVANIVRENQKQPVDFRVVSCPEFTREGAAINDFLRPDRVILGSTDRDAAERVALLHLPLRSTVVLTDLYTAEMIKYASNAFLATKISFINEIALICETLGADVKEVAAGMGYDRRIGRDFLDAGLGWGGSCFPKDVKALCHMATEKGKHPQMLQSVMDINMEMRRLAIRKLRESLGNLKGRRIAVLGMAFKPNTDDLREAPSLEVVQMLRAEGAIAVACDPVVSEKSVRELKLDLEFHRDAYVAVKGADGLIIVTEWNEFKTLDLERLKNIMRHPVFMDARNIYDPHSVEAAGLIYLGLGRGRRKIDQTRVVSPIQVP